MTAGEPEPAVLARDLSKSYGSRDAVAGLDLTVPAGEIFGFLGPNGAGKTTTVGMLCTLLRPTLGRAVVAGHDVAADPDAVRRDIALVFQESTLDGDLTGEENLRFHADLFGMPRRRAQEAIAAMLELVDLAERKDSPVRTYSGGMRRRLEIARGLLRTPRVLFLDEPTTGLDPQTRTAIWAYLRRMREERTVTVFLTTHQLDEADNCDRIAIIDGGGKVAEDTPAKLKTVIGADLVELRTGDDEAAVRAVRDRFGLDAERGPGGVRLRTTDGAAFVPRLCAELAVPVHAVTVTPPTLDDVFLHYTGHSIRDETTGPRSLAAVLGGARG